MEQHQSSLSGTDEGGVPGSASPDSGLIGVGRAARDAALRLATLSGEARDQAIEAIAVALEAAAPAILAANAADCEAAQADGIAPSLYARLKLDETKLRGEAGTAGDVVDRHGVVGLRTKRH